MCLTIILILLLLSGSTESKSCRVYPTTTVRRLPSNSCCTSLLPGRESTGNGKLLLVVTGRTPNLKLMRGKRIVITIDEIDNSNSSRLLLESCNACRRQQSTSPSANCESSDPEEKEDASFYTTVGILSFLVCVLGFTVAVLAVALYRNRRTKRTARQPLPPPPVLQVPSHDYSTVYEELPNVDGVKTQEEQNRLTENHERYTLRGLSENNGVPNRTMTRKAVTIKGAQERVDTATSSSEEHMYSVLEKEIEEVRSDDTYSIDKEGTYHVLEDCLPEKDQDEKEEEDHYHVLDPETVSTEEISTEEQTG